MVRSSFALAALLMGCAGSSSQTPAKAPQPLAAAPAPAPAPQGVANTMPDEPTTADEGAVLIVSKEVVDRCPGLQQVRKHGHRLDPEVVWIVVLEGLADCMTQGPLHGRRVTLAGKAEHVDVIKEILSSRGVGRDRTLPLPASTEPATCKGKQCPSADPRVEIALAPSGGTT